MRKTASRTSSTRSTRLAGRRGFTLVEILIAFALASVLMTGIMTTFLMMARTGVLAQNYTELEVQGRKALETFSREARMANGISAWGNATVTLSIPDTSYDRTATSYSVTYAFDSTDPNDVKFTRTGPPLTNPSGTSSTTTLVTYVKQISGTNYINYFKYVTSNYSNGFTSNTATKTAEIKQIELNFIAQRTTKTVATSTDKVLSARFILRNK